MPRKPKLVIRISVKDEPDYVLSVIEYDNLGGLNGFMERFHFTADDIIEERKGLMDGEAFDELPDYGL